MFEIYVKFMQPSHLHEMIVVWNGIELTKTWERVLNVSSKQKVKLYDVKAVVSKCKLNIS